MNTTEEVKAVSVTSHAVAAHETAVEPGKCTTAVQPERSARRRMMIAGSLGLVAAALVVASPEIGIGGMIGGAVAGSGSALATLFARR
jgi:hypothetical protein